ncbi:MAG: tripartite tricarboxylate transporter permease [Candidatus Lambdaproteobacteria bacterium]|nr:tripartite tricarboxylate transporter permease [Candidatus Lambdaproteobacteria bacterium]
MDILSGLIGGFGVILTPANLYYCFLGSLVGTLIGVLPGIGPLATLSLLLPFTFNLPAVSAIVMLAAIFYGAMYGGSTTSILVNIPGEAASVITCLDGYQMARQGKAGRALGIAALGSFFAGTLSTAALTLFSPVLVAFALRFGPPEYFALMALGFVITLFMVAGSTLKAVVVLALGVFFSTIGLDIVTGKERFTFGLIEISGGFELVAVIMGLFGVSEILLNMEKMAKGEFFKKRLGSLLPTRADWRASGGPILRGSLLGFGLGVLPGGGPTTASFFSYAVERRVSKEPQRFGAGAIEGVAGPEAANNAAVGGSLIPLLSLGLPSNAVTALLLGALIIQGVQPGPMLMTQRPDIYWGVIASLYVGNVMLLVLNLPLVGLWVQLLKLPYWILFPNILLLAVVGTYSAGHSFFDVWVMIAFGMVGYALRKLDYEPAPFVLALVLGPQLEQALRQSLIMSEGSVSIFFTRPLTAVLLVLAAALVALLIVGVWSRRGLSRRLTQALKESSR